MNGVKVSVVVPTYNRKDLLMALLESLRSQTLAPETFEIIVVCDGGTDGTSEVIARLATSDARIRLIQQQQGGPAAARNAGARAAKGQFVAFTDDDCLAAPHWLVKLIEPFAGPETVAVQGKTTTDLTLVGPLTHQLVNESKSYIMPTCNVAYRRDLFLKMGGFDERFLFLNEDVDLGWRFETAGLISFAPDALIIHPPRKETFSKKAKWVRFLESEFLLYYKDPVRYRKHRSFSPWCAIYWNVFVLLQIRSLKSSLKFVFVRFRPDYFCLTVALVLARWWNLIRYYPNFLRAARRPDMLMHRTGIF
jgi:GT2 family glycosyltransferase